MTRAVIEQYLQAQESYDPDGLGRLRHPEWMAEWPQSGERTPDHAADVAIHTNYPGYPEHDVITVAGQPQQWTLTPMLVPIRISGDGPLWVVEMKLRYPDGQTWFALAIMEVEQELVRREVVYFCATGEAPSWRAGWAKPLEEASSRSEISVEGDPLDRDRWSNILEKFLDVARDQGRAAAASMLYHDDVVYDIPQSRERIEGLTDLTSALGNDPRISTFIPGRLWGTGNLLVVELSSRDGEEDSLEVDLLQFRGEKVARATEYEARSFEPPEWRSRWVEKM